jgi:hypothetical protein
MVRDVLGQRLSSALKMFGSQKRPAEKRQGRIALPRANIVANYV